MKKTVFFMLALLPAIVFGQKARKMQYFPEGREIVCVNGTNRYTRSLYGTHTLFRLETSDRPVFATYDGKQNRNIRLAVEGVALDSADYCRTGYSGGRRTYLLTDRRWADDTRVCVTVLALQSEEGAIWRIETGKPLEVTAVVCPTRKQKMEHAGELGIVDMSGFDADEAQGVERLLQCAKGGVAYLLLENGKAPRWIDGDGGSARFAREEKALAEMVGRVEFSTPDPYINVLGANLMAAADGLWDGETWLHGCVGWRAPLAGWRAGYLGDVLGWHDRAVSHFDAYIKSMVTNVEPTLPQPQMDPKLNLARALKQWGTPMYSNGYICRLPNRNDLMHHYDMNLNYIDELLWHFQYDADREYLRKMWPYLKLHLEWEKRNWDPDGDHLYDAYCCIWASDALYYNGGAVTHSSAYNYRANLLAARIAELLGEDGRPYAEEAQAILDAMNRRLWVKDEGHWAEYEDLMGLGRLHKSAALWSIYTPIDCGACTPEQAWQATVYVDSCIPHIPVVAEGIERRYETVSTSTWMPYEWSTNNVAHEEVLNMALAYFEAGRAEAGFNLLKADILDGMFLGQCPGNFGQISYYDKARSEAYRDFGDNIGVAARALINGLFGILPDALNGQCIVKPAFPAGWDSASIRTPYLSYKFRREGSKDIYEIQQKFRQPLRLIVRINAGGGAIYDVAGTTDSVQTIVVDRTRLPQPVSRLAVASRPRYDDETYMERMGLGGPDANAAYQMVDISRSMNASVDDIFRQQYLSPRPPYTTLQLPVQGLGDWCTTDRTATIEDDGLRRQIRNGIFDTGVGVRFRLPADGNNIAYTSLWDNYPDSVTIPVKGRGRYAWLLMAGSTNQMQSRIDNGLVVATYTDGTTDTLHLENPVNWCPIQEDYLVDDYAFRTAPLRPYRIHLGSGFTSRDISSKLIRDPQKDYYRTIDCGAAQMLRMPLNPRKRLKYLTVRTLANDVIIGLMAVTLEQ